MSKPRVLCVDDDQDNLVAVEAILSHEFDVVCCRSAKQALAHLKTDKDYAIILSDQRMPEMTGVDFLVQSLSLTTLPIRILFTGYSNLESAIEAINRAQIYRYLTKPWQPADLLLTLKEAYQKFSLALELKLKNEQLKKALQDIQAMDKVKTNFMILINHELKTPLTAISSYLELLKEENLGPLPEKYLGRIEEGCLRLKFLTNEVMYLLNNNNDVLNSMSHGLAETNLNDLLRPYKMNDKFKVNIKTNELSAAMTEKVLKNVIERLTQNALKFKKEGVINININDCGDDLMFEISNLSEQIKQTDLERILEPFELNREVMNHSGGLGLGLPIIQVLLKKVGSELIIKYEDKKFIAQFIVNKRPLLSENSKLNFT